MKPNADSGKVQEIVSTVSARRRRSPSGDEHGAAFAMPFQPGDVLGGKYEVNDLIGVGGIAFVVSARHIGFDSFVALKFLRPELAQMAEARARFTVEAQNNFRLESEHIVRVLDVDVLPQGLPFMVMELLQGRDLRTALAHGPLSVPFAAEYVLQVAVALASAHANGLVHCDIKPENLFVLDGAGDEPAIKVLDFGIARAVQGVPSQARRVSSSGAVGSPPYMSPEQVRASADLDARTDIWSLGCVLYELLTLRVPFHRQSRMESCAAVLEQDPPSLRALRPDLPAELETVLARCLRKVASERYSDVAELAAALVPFAPERARRHAERCRQLLSAGPRLAVATDPGRRSRPGAAPLASLPRVSSPESLVATQLMDSPEPEPAVAPPARPRRRGAWLLGAAAFASVAGFALMQLAQRDAGWSAPVAATARPEESLAKGTHARSLTPQLAPGPVTTASAAALTAPVHVPADSLPLPTQAAPSSEARPTLRASRPLARKPSASRSGANRPAGGAQATAHASHALHDEPDVGF